jgi:hypothetical protein
MSADAGPRGCRFQLQRDRDGMHRWYLFNANGTLVGRHAEGFATEREARLDAEKTREQIVSAPVVGEGDEALSAEPS